MTAASFCEQVAATARKLRPYALRLTKRTDAADDLMQDTVLRALAAERQFVLGTNLTAWLTTIMRNQHLSNARTAGRLKHDVDGLATKLMRAPNNQADAYEAKDALSFIIYLTPEQQRAVLMAANGLTVDQIAEREHVPAGTIKSRIHRGRARLANLIGEPWRAVSAEVGAP